MKIQTLKTFVGCRYDLKGEHFSRALNEIFLVFNDSPIVLNLLSDFHGKVVARQPPEDELLKLFKAMCSDVKMNYVNFNDSFFLKAFNTANSSMTNVLPK